MNDETTFSKRLTKLNSHLSFKVITKDEAKPELKGNTLILNQHGAGDVVIKYGDTTILEMQEIEGVPCIKLEVRYVDKTDANMLADLIKLRGDYLPDEDDEQQNVINSQI